ncbi:MAG: pyroglutamyl-peptidase I [Planctomycetota bacterium]
MSAAEPIRLLVTGFEPFGGSTLNPSQAVIQALDAETFCAVCAKLHTALLPVDTQRIAASVESFWQTIEPHIVIHLGESAKASRLTLERVALNLLDFDTPDNAGEIIVDQPIDPSGPAALFATLPARALKDRLKQQQIDTELSLSAGAYLCNQTLYLSLIQAQQRGGASVGFVHIPSLPEQVELGERNEPSMLLDQLLHQVQSLLVHLIDLYQGDESPSRD